MPVLAVVGSHTGRFLTPKPPVVNGRYGQPNQVLGVLPEEFLVIGRDPYSQGEAYRDEPPSNAGPSKSVRMCGALSLRCRSVLATWHGRFGRLKASPGMCTVAERFGRGSPAAAERKGPLGYRVRCTIPVDSRHVFALHKIRPVLSYLYRRHCVSPCVVRIRTWSL